MKRLSDQRFATGEYIAIKPTASCLARGSVAQGRAPALCQGGLALPSVPPMGKHKKRARNGGPPQPHPAAAMAATKPADGGASDDDDDDDDEWGGFEVAEVATAIRVVAKLGRRPDLFASKLFKPLRAALDPLVQLQLKKYDPVDYAGRVTAALQQRKGHDALLGLQGMRANGQVAKQGTVQRWVRDCDSIPNEGGLRVRLLQAVLQAGRPIDEPPHE
eukprot:3692734-Prymnesium_polylepis.1